ncbi:hypothetical protein C8N24_2866 [Solirubrobacter pauli]|uniref:AAA ATPase-like protein n=1 Tax=Solirubrobacter pauli TaxID=166793 RepID=A0A660LD82_9ACTN|nr:hypothetical protein [Solirubrobacter pauli]RKQ93007.1 hypothetical protein C8N24_2866 [Solirubrobacter pauli]
MHLRRRTCPPQAIEYVGAAIGRRAQLEEIDAALRDRSVVVEAAAGIGKSCLVREVVAAQEAGGALTDWVQATRSAATIPLARW